MTDGRAFSAILVSWLAAQLIKFALAWLTTGGFLKGRAMKTGGMPSAHAALVSSLAYCAGALHGPGSIEFLTALTLALIVSFDAIGMRAEFHKQGLLLKDLAVKEYGPQYVAEKYPKLGEFQGHEVAEVLAGLVSGALVSAIVLNI